MPGRPPADNALDLLTADLVNRFSSAGNTPITVPHLFPGDMLLDLYGEDLRARAFMVRDGAHRPELCLRPDFTVPVVLEHRARGWDQPAGYVCSGNVFRRQTQAMERPAEYLQVGVERIGYQDRLAEDANVFTLISDALRAQNIASPAVTIGDLGIVFGLLDAIPMPEIRRFDLKRHVWRPERFLSLIERFQRPVTQSTARAELLGDSDLPSRANALIAASGDPIGSRSPGDVTARLERLREDASNPVMPSADAQLITDFLAVQCPAADAPQQLRQVLRSVADKMSDVLQTFERRLDLVAAAGADLDNIRFDAAFGRSLEYYDGFVFEFSLPGRADLPSLAAGGRYDAMTRQLGAPDTVPAVGAMIRPETVMQAVQ